MATIKEDYCSFELSKLLKEKGFDTSKIDAYFPFVYYSNGKMDFYDDDKPLFVCEAVTQAMAMKWLREVHGLFIFIEPCFDYELKHAVYLAFIQNVADVHEFMDGRKHVASHPNAEKSCELAIKYCLENLI